MSLRRSALAGAAVVSLVLAYPLAGCGGDDDETPTQTKTTAPVDAKAPEGDQGAGSPQDEGTQAKGGSGGTETPDESDSADTADGGGGTGYDPEQDTEENDLPPPEGSPGERMEQVCRENPGAC